MAARARYAEREESVEQMQDHAGVAEERRFDAAFQGEFAELLAWRRDVRRFRPAAVPEATLDLLFGLTAFAPSVGNCQPTRFVRVDDEARRERSGPISRRPTTRRSAPIAASGRSSTRP